MLIVLLLLNVPIVACVLPLRANTSPRKTNIKFHVKNNKHKLGVESRPCGTADRRPQGPLISVPPCRYIKGLNHLLDDPGVPFIIPSLRSWSFPHFSSVAHIEAIFIVRPVQSNTRRRSTKRDPQIQKMQHSERLPRDTTILEVICQKVYK